MPKTDEENSIEIALTARDHESALLITISEKFIESVSKPEYSTDQ